MMGILELSIYGTLLRSWLALIGVVTVVTLSVAVARRLVMRCSSRSSTTSRPQIDHQAREITVARVEVLGDGRDGAPLSSLTNGDLSQ